MSPKSRGWRLRIFSCITALFRRIASQERWIQLTVTSRIDFKCPIGTDYMVTWADQSLSFLISSMCYLALHNLDEISKVMVDDKLIWRRKMKFYVCWSKRKVGQVSHKSRDFVDLLSTYYCLEGRPHIQLGISTRGGHWRPVKGIVFCKRGKYALFDY